MVAGSLFIFEIRSCYVAQDALELNMYPRLLSNAPPCCLCLPRAEIANVHQYTWLMAENVQSELWTLWYLNPNCSRVHLIKKILVFYISTTKLPSLKWKVFNRAWFLIHIWIFTYFHVTLYLTYVNCTWLSLCPFKYNPVKFWQPVAAGRASLLWNSVKKGLTWCWSHPLPSWHCQWAQQSGHWSSYFPLSVK